MQKDIKYLTKLILLFTLEHGLQMVVFRGVKGANAKLKSAKEIFSFGDFIYTEGNNKVVISADISNSFYEITKDIKKYYTACAILDVIKTVLPMGESNPQLFVLTLKCLEMLAYENIDNYIVLNKFLISIFEGLGYSFNVNKCNNCGLDLKINRYMNLSYGDITCPLCKIGLYIEISVPVCQALRILHITDIEKLKTLKIPKDT